MPKAIKSKTASTQKAVAKAVSNAVYTQAHSDLFMNRITNTDTRASEDKKYFQELHGLNVLPSHLLNTGPFREALKGDLFKRVGSEFSDEFATQLQTLGTNAVITAPKDVNSPNSDSNARWSGKTRKRKDWYNTLIEARLSACSRGYQAALAAGVVVEDEDGNGICLREQDGKLVKIQGNNAGIAKTPDGTLAWEDKNLEMHMRHLMTRRDVIATQIQRSPDNVPSTSLDLLKDLEVGIARWKTHIPKGWKHTKS